MGLNSHSLRRLVMNIFTSGMYGKGDPGVQYKFMMLNLILIVGTPFVLGFGLFDIYRGVQPLGYIITSAGLIGVGCFYFLRMTKKYVFLVYFAVSVLFLMFLYLLGSGGSNNSGILWYYSFPPIALFLLGFRIGSAVVSASLAIAGAILFWPGTPLLAATYTAEQKLRFIPSVIILWAITSLFEHVKAAAMRIEIKNNELRDSVDQLRRAREALSSEKGRLAATLRSIGDGVIATGTDGKVTLMNTVAEEMTGWRLEDAAGRGVGEIVRVADRNSDRPCETALASVLRTGRAASAREYRVLAGRNGEKRIISDSGAPILDEDGQMIGAVLVFRDVTDRVRMEEDLYRTGKLESVGLLAGGIAHDFNNILAGIGGNAELAKIAGEKGNDTGVYLKRISKASRRATALTHQLLTFAKGGAPVIRRIDLSNMLRETVEFALSGSPVRSEVMVPDDLWAVYADSGQLVQVISNLVINAAQASPEGGRIEVAAENAVVRNEQMPALAAGKYVMLTVRDHGTGIAPEFMDKIFDPYFTTKAEGTGLGLAIAYSIMKKHNGQIGFDSQVGEGTVFTLHLPASFEKAEREVPVGGVTVDARYAGKVLIVDDEEDLRQCLAEILQHAGFEVCAVGDGKKAISAYREAMTSQRPFDIVITDLTIPGGMGGRETVERLLQIDPEARVVVSSGYSQDPILADYSRYGFRGIIRKPYEFEGLADTVARLIALP